MGSEVIRAWLYHLEDYGELEPHLVKTKRGEAAPTSSVDMGIEDTTRNSQLGTTDQDTRPQRSPKRRRTEDGNDGNDENREEDPFTGGISTLDLHATPRAPTRTTTYTNALSTNSPTRLSSTSASSRSSSHRTRSTSPVKRADDLLKLQKPVRFTRQNPSDLATTMAAGTDGDRTLFRTIKSKVTSRRGILPLELRDIILLEMGCAVDDHDLDHLFQTTTRSAKNASKKERWRRRLLSADDQQQQQQTIHTEQDMDHMVLKLSLLDELDTLNSIVAKTNDFKSAPRSEAAWNEHVHCRILELAVMEEPGVGVENVTRANIAKPFQPRTRQELQLEVPLSAKMIDYAMVLRPTGPDDALGTYIQDMVARLQTPTFNQSMYDPLRTAPSGVFIETKVETKRYPEAQAQLGIWLATWFGRVSEFQPSGSRSIVVPVLIATAEAWELWFALDRQDHFDVCGVLTVGGTEDLQSIYLLRDVLCSLASWMATDFRRWVEFCVGFRQA